MTHVTGSLWKTPGPLIGMICGSAAPTFALWSTGAIGIGTALLLALIPAALLVGLVRSLRGPRERSPSPNSALRSYTWRMMAGSTAYVVLLMLAVGLYNNFQLSSAALGAVAILPIAPALVMVWAMMRYLLDERDEYLRHRANMAALVGLGLVLVLGTVWGFLETFGVVPHVWAWWVVPVWAIGLGIGQGLFSRREHAGGAQA